MQALLADPSPIPDAAPAEPLEGKAVGNVLHTDEAGRFHVMAVVFPEGTSSGVHHHGCWGVIGYLQGGVGDALPPAGRRPTPRSAI